MKPDWEAIAAETAQATRERHEEALQLAASEIEIELDGEFHRVDEFTLGFIDQHRSLITNPEDWPFSYWVIQLMMAGF